MQHRLMITGIALAAALVTAWSPAAAQESDSAQALSSERQTASSAAARPAPDVTRYTLVEVAGKRLPALVEKEWGCEENVTAGTLALSEDGRWSLETVTREVCGGRTDEDRDNDDGTYRAGGGTLRFLDDDGRDSDGDSDLELDELETGTIAKDGMLQVQLADGKTILVFRR